MKKCLHKRVHDNFAIDLVPQKIRLLIYACVNRKSKHQYISTHYMKICEFDSFVIHSSTDFFRCGIVLRMKSSRVANSEIYLYRYGNEEEGSHETTISLSVY